MILHKFFLLELMQLHVPVKAFFRHDPNSAYLALCWLLNFGFFSMSILLVLWELMNVFELFIATIEVTLVYFGIRTVMNPIIMLEELSLRWVNLLILRVRTLCTISTDLILLSVILFVMTSKSKVRSSFVSTARLWTLYRIAFSLKLFIPTQVVIDGCLVVWIVFSVIMKMLS